MKQKSLVKNVIYNFIYSGLNILFPLITAPYVSRVLGATNLGKVNFATVIVNWFILFAAFGTTSYGIREIAKNRDDREKLNNVFSEIVVINGILSFFVFIIYMIIVFNSNQFADERNLYLIMSVSIFLNMFAMDWFYQGIEEYRYIIIRSAIFKVFSLIGIFLFVKEVEHYEIYGLISVLAMSLSGVLNYLYSRKLVTLKLRDIKPLKHMKSLSVFFMITFVINIYTNLDQALLGFLVDSKSVAFMNRSKTITGIAVSISTAITNTTLPRASYYIQNDKENYDLLINRVPEYILWFTVPITIGCITLAESIMYILGGIEFIDASNLLKIVSLTIIFSPLSTYYQTQVLAASGKEKNGLHIAYITSIISLILNIILIPILGFIGAGIVQVISELTAVGLRYFVAKKKLGFSNLKLITHSTMSYVGAAIFMGAIVLLINSYISDYIVAFIVSVLSGGAIYIFSLLILREKVTLLALNSLRDKIQRLFDNMV